MRKITIAVFTGAIILFVWQTLSNTVLQLHRSSQQYTPKQDTIMSMLSSNFNEDGRYFMPTLPEGASNEDYKKLQKNSTDKPWAIIAYHHSLNANMPVNILRTLLTDIAIVWLLCWILLKMPDRKFATIFLATLFTGIIAFLNGLYTQYIWYQDPGIYAHFFDAIISWALCGLWLGRWLRS